MDSLPEPFLSTAFTDEEVVPQYLGAADYPWLRSLLDEYARFEGTPRHTLEERLREPLQVVSDPARVRRARYVLDRLTQGQVDAPVKPSAVRFALFAAATRSHSVLQAKHEAAACLAISPQILDHCLFADLPGERPVGPLPGDLNPTDLALRTNRALVGGLLSKSLRVRVKLWGNARDVVRQARLSGLMTTVRASGAAELGGEPAVEIDISGPLALFRRTSMYGRALARLVPRLSWCERFELRAECKLRESLRTLVVRSGDPILPAEAREPFDSRLEERFAKRFAKHAPEWKLTREPQPLRAGEKLIFVDFALTHRHDPARRWLLEVAGFWTPEYLETKLRDLQAAGHPRLILCIDAKRDCADGAMPAGARIVRYKSSIDPRAVLAIVGE